MAITIDDFDKVWASESPLTPYEFNDSQYKQGWNFVGATPPSRQMWDAFMKNADEKLKYLAQGNLISAPIGCVQAFAGSTTPDGWLFCDGSAVSRITYAELYSVIGDTYGAGDGTDTFNLPNLTDKFIEGSSTSGTEKSAGLPNITGYVDWIMAGNSASTATGAFEWEQITGTMMATTSGTVPANIIFNASLSNSIYGNSNTVQPPALTMRYIIKY